MAIKTLAAIAVAALLSIGTTAAEAQWTMQTRPNPFGNGSTTYMQGPNGENYTGRTTPNPFGNGSTTQWNGSGGMSTCRTTPNPFGNGSTTTCN
jgi:hypothetical protein